MADPYVGKLIYLRVYSGTLEAGSYVYNSTRGKKERIGRLLQMHANHGKSVKRVSAGDIAAAVRARNPRRGHALLRAASPSCSSPWSFPSRSSPWPSSPRPRPTRTS